MINQVIESLRSELYSVTNSNGITSPSTLQLSQDLNRYLNFYTRSTKDYVKLNHSNSFVHSNAIMNILQVSSEEKLDLTSILETKEFSKKKWHRIELVTSLLDYVSTNYGWEAVEYMGEFVPEKCIFPGTVDHFTSSIQNLNHIYYKNHKSVVYIGEYLPYMPIKNDITLFCHTPHYPAAFNHGIVKGLAKKFNHSLKLSLLDKENGGQFKINL